MNVNLLTDAPKHNLALMKLSAWHKQNGDHVTLNMPVMPCDKSYASVLYEKHRKMFDADEYGGPVFVGSVLPEKVETMFPDYSLYPEIDFSLGYTFRPCFRGCSFCKVPEMTHPDCEHHSIWEFHDSRFKKICLLNNNTFFDKQWRETFEEIWEADLTVMDENGYDLRLMDEEKAWCLKKTKWGGRLHYAWDQVKDEKAVLRGLSIAPKGTVYVLVGYNTTQDEDFYRCQKIVDAGHDVYVMPFNGTKTEKAFKRFMDSFMWRKYPTLELAWRDYR